VKRFLAPPNWPTPPRRDWVPPKHWAPDPTWPPAPSDWCFWVGASGKPAIGPLGRYGAPSVRAAYLGLGVAVIFVSINLWAVSSLGLLDGTSQSEDSPLPRTTARPTPLQTVTVTTARTPAPTRAKPTPVAVKPPIRTSRPLPPARSGPTPTPSSGPKEPAPTRASSPPLPSTQPAGSYEAQCRRFGIDPKWCVPYGRPTP
jgi:hypothetical protein